MKGNTCYETNFVTVFVPGGGGGGGAGYPNSTGGSGGEQSNKGGNGTSNSFGSGGGAALPFIAIRQPGRVPHQHAHDASVCPVKSCSTDNQYWYPYKLLATDGSCSTYRSPITNQYSLQNSRAAAGKYQVPTAAVEAGLCGAGW